MGGEINQRFWDSYVNHLNGILPGFTSSTIRSYNGFPGQYPLSARLQHNILQTIDYMHRHQIITGNAMSKFLEINNTLQMVAFTRVYVPHWRGVHDKRRNCPECGIAVLNEWHSDQDKRFSKGQLLIA
jgi:ribosomal protein S27AE